MPCPVGTALAVDAKPVGGWHGAAFARRTHALWRGARGHVVPCPHRAEHSDAGFIGGGWCWCVETPEGAVLVAQRPAAVISGPEPRAMPGGRDRVRALLYRQLSGGASSPITAGSTALGCVCSIQETASVTFIHDVNAASEMAVCCLRPPRSCVTHPSVAPDHCSRRLPDARQDGGGSIPNMSPTAGRGDGTNQVRDDGLRVCENR